MAPLEITSSARLGRATRWRLTNRVDRDLFVAIVDPEDEAETYSVVLGVTQMPAGSDLDVTDMLATEPTSDQVLLIGPSVETISQALDGRLSSPRLGAPLALDITPARRLPIPRRLTHTLLATTGLAILGYAIAGGGPPAAAAPGADEGGAEGSSPIAYGQIDAPDAVEPGEQFEIVVGLSPEPDPEIFTERLELPAGPVVVDVLLMAPDCELEAGMTWARTLNVTDDDPFPWTVYRASRSSTSTKPFGVLKAKYSIGGRLIGTAERGYAVHGPTGIVAADARIRRSPALDSRPNPDVDVEITVSANPGQARGWFQWTVTSPRYEIHFPDEPVSRDLGEGSQEFANKLRDRVDRPAAGLGDPADVLRAVSKLLASFIPQEVWTALQDVASHLNGEPPTVLLHSDEPFVPWELAKVPAGSPLSVVASPLLGAQVVFGRWPMRRPWSVQPPGRYEVSNVAVIRGKYKWSMRLPGADREAEFLRRTYQAQVVDAKKLPVASCLFNNSPSVSVLHFAIHGERDPGDPANDGLLLADGTLIELIDANAIQMVQNQFVFLNACQAGAGNTMLTNCAGFSEAFVAAGASGVIAPQWSIYDKSAEDLCQSFYDELARGSCHPAEFLRQKRASFDFSSEEPDITTLGYQYFGHPDLGLHRATA